jgi:hypothetical protein
MSHTSFYFLRSHFQITTANGTDTYDATMACLSSSHSWRSCTHLAETWLDQPIA